MKNKSFVLFFVVLAVIFLIIPEVKACLNASKFSVGDWYCYNEDQYSIITNDSGCLISGDFYDCANGTYCNATAQECVSGNCNESVTVENCPEWSSCSSLGHQYCFYCTSISRDCAVCADNCLIDLLLRHPDVQLGDHYCFDETQYGICTYDIGSGCNIFPEILDCPAGSYCNSSEACQAGNCTDEVTVANCGSADKWSSCSSLGTQYCFDCMAVTRVCSNYTAYPVSVNVTATGIVWLDNWIFSWSTSKKMLVAVGVILVLVTLVAVLVPSAVLIVISTVLLISLFSVIGFIPIWVDILIVIVAIAGIVMFKGISGG